MRIYGDPMSRGIHRRFWGSAFRIRTSTCEDTTKPVNRMMSDGRTWLGVLLLWSWLGHLDAVEGYLQYHLTTFQLLFFAFKLYLAHKEHNLDA